MPEARPIVRVPSAIAASSAASASTPDLPGITSLCAASARRYDTCRSLAGASGFLGCAIVLLLLHFPDAGERPVEPALVLGRQDALDLVRVRVDRPTDGQAPAHGR